MARVLILASFADSLIRFRGPLIAALLAEGHVVEVASPHAVQAIAASPFAGRVIAHDIALARTGLDPSADIRLLLAYRRLIGRVAPDVIFAYSIKPVIYGGLAARSLAHRRFFALITGLGYVFENNSRKAQLLRAIVRPLYRRALARAAAIFFQNSDNLALFRDSGIVRRAARVEVVGGSGIDLSHYAPMPLPREPAVLMIARLLIDKGVAEYAAAAAIVRAEMPDVRFRLVGWFNEGNPASLRREDLDAWQATGAIEWLGAKSDVRPALAACSFYVLPSHHEGMPRTVLEALATALLDRHTHHCDIVETGNESWRFKNREAA